MSYRSGWRDRVEPLLAEIADGPVKEVIRPMAERLAQYEHDQEVLLGRLVRHADEGKHLRDLLRGIAQQAQFLLDLDGDRIPPHVQLWLRDLVVDFGEKSDASMRRSRYCAVSDRSMSRPSSR